MVRKKIPGHEGNNLTELECALLKCFFPEAEEITIAKIKERSGYSYERINTGLKQLEKKKIVFSKTIGKTLVYTADYQNLYLKLAFYYYMTGIKIDFLNRYKLIFKSLQEVSEESFGIVLLYGSYSKGNETKSSDIDLMVVSDYPKIIEGDVNKIKSTRGQNITLALVKTMEFPKIKKENPELWKDLKQYAIIFKGLDSYYYWMYQNANN